MYDAWDLYYLRLPKRLLREVGPVGACVFARIAGYCDMEKHVCFASQENIAEELGVSRATVNRHIAELVSLGYVVDLGMEPRSYGRIHKYDVITWDDHDGAL